jgi:hypothetical protein
MSGGGSGRDCGRMSEWNILSSSPSTPAPRPRGGAVSVSLAARAPEVRAGLDDEIPPFAGEGVERRLVVLVPGKTAELREEMTLVSSAVNPASTMACQVMADFADCGGGLSMRWGKGAAAGRMGRHERRPDPHGRPGSVSLRRNLLHHPLDVLDRVDQAHADVIIVAS